jgi:hypothetical protein
MLNGSVATKPGAYVKPGDRLWVKELPAAPQLQV